MMETLLGINHSILMLPPVQKTFKEKPSSKSTN